jgi:hypothetical protein
MSGFTPLPNYVYELAPSLTEAELRVLLYLYRRIAGWHKEADQISLSQFQAGTGLTFVAALRSLEARRLIRAERHSTKTTRFALVPEADKQLVPLPDKRLVPEADRALVPQADTQKKEEIKAKDRKAWEAALVRLQGMMSAPNYQTFCADLELVTLTATTLIIRAPSAYVATTLRQKWLPLIQKALGRRVVITIVDGLCAPESAG